MTGRELLQRIFIVGFAFLPVLHAQDTRQVSEPRIPAACTAIDARLAAPNGVLSDGDERTADTARIQAAIDSCTQGRAVVLRPAGRNNIFLAGPIQLKPGVTLVVEANAALFASRNPRDYDVAPGSCGVVGERARMQAIDHRRPRSGQRHYGRWLDRWTRRREIDRAERDMVGSAKSAKVIDKNQAVPRV